MAQLPQAPARLGGAVVFLVPLLLLILAPPLPAQTDAPPEQTQVLAPVFEELPPVGQVPAEINGNLELEFTGNTSISAEKLREELGRQIQNIEQYGLDAAGAYDAAFYTAKIYQDAGHANVQVQEQTLGPWRLRLAITEGPRVRVGQVTFTGATAHTAEELRNYLLGPTRERFPEIQEALGLPFVRAEVEAGTDLVRRLYRTDGYLEATVSEPSVSFSADGTVADVAITIQEGRAYSFGQVSFAGSPELPRQELLPIIQEETEGPYTEGRLASARRKLVDHYNKNGYFTAEVEATSDPGVALEGRVPVVFTIQAGPVYTFDGVEVTGTDRLTDDFMRKRFARLSGRTYSPDRIDRQYRRLIETGLFSNLNISPEAIPGTTQVRLNVTMEEAPPKEFGIGVGFATYDGGIFTLSYRDRNLKGTGRPLDFKTALSTRGYNGELKYTDPWLWDTEYEMELRLFAEAREEEGYSRQVYAFQPSLARRFTRHWRSSIFLLGKSVEIRDVLIEPYELIGLDNYTTASIGISNVFDYRNNRALPTSGWIFRNTVDATPGDLLEFSYVRSVTQLSVYLPVTSDSHLALGARANLIKPLGETEDLPIEERFFNGGPTTVRSFTERDLGPKDDAGEYPIGGEASLTFNVEYTFPLYRDLKGAAFVDAGNVTPKFGKFGSDDMRYGVGLGVRYNLPIGALRLDYARNPNPAQGEDDGAFHFAIGVAF